MWFLTCDGDLFAGKRLWLRPGSTHLLGRTSGRSDAGERIQYIDHKSVSRKHLIIRVGNVSAGDSARLHTRSEIQVTDGSKMGSTINGDKIVQQSRTLEEGKKGFVIRLGNYQHEFQLRWTPVTLSFTSLSKKAKAADDPLHVHREKLEQADVKLVLEYVTNETSHVITKKRNTPSALQALAQAKWVMTEGFASALGTVVYRGADNISALEHDFDGNWPREEDFIAPAAGEPQPRPNEVLKPNPDRAEVFHDFTFVFLSQAQYDLLLPAIAAAGGKGLLWEVEVGKSKSQDLVKYIKEVAEQKGSGQFRSNQQPRKGGVVVVRLNGGEAGWMDFMKAVDIELDQRSVEQNEFLDAVLTLDASGLRRQLKDADDSLEPASSIRASATPAVSQSRQQGSSQVRETSISRHSPEDQPSSGPSKEQTEPPQPSVEASNAEEPAAPDASSAATKRRARRFVTKSRFQGFDEFDPSQASLPKSPSPEPSASYPEPSQPASIPQSMDVDEPEATLRTQQRSLKRPPPSPEEDEENMYESMLTGVAAMERRKMEAAQKGEKNAFAEESLAKIDQKPTRSAARARKKAKEIDVMAEVQKRREAEEEQRRKDEGSLREGLNGMDISQLKNLAQIEEMEVPVRDKPSRQNNADGPSDRWDPAWNGRRNFKKFRPQGERREPLRLRPVMITLEEAPKRGHGMGDEYWLTPSATENRSSQTLRPSSQTLRNSSAAQRSQPADETSEDPQRFRRRLEHSHRQDADDAAAEEILPEEIAGTARNEEISQTMGSESQRRAAGKRSAAQTNAEPPAKKTRSSRTTGASTREAVVVDDDDGDDLKFRRRRRG